MAHTTKNNSTEIKHYWSMPFLFFSWFFFFWPNSLATPWEYWVTSCLWQFSSFNKSFLPVYLMSSPFIILPFNVCLFFWLFFFFNPEGKKRLPLTRGSWRTVCMQYGSCIPSLLLKPGTLHLIRGLCIIASF